MFSLGNYKDDGAVIQFVWAPLSCINSLFEGIKMKMIIIHRNAFLLRVTESVMILIKTKRFEFN